MGPRSISKSARTLDKIRGSVKDPVGDGTIGTPSGKRRTTAVTVRPRRGGAAAFGQRGFAMIAFLSMLAIITAYFIVNTLGASRNFTASNRNNNAKVLNQAKQALIGYVAQQAAEASEKNPGRFPCPEAINNVGTSSEGISAPFIGTLGPPPIPSTPSCAPVGVPVGVGRLPWRTLGIDKLLDAAGEPLWYVVSPGIWGPAEQFNITYDQFRHAGVSYRRWSSKCRRGADYCAGSGNERADFSGLYAVNQVRTVPSSTINPQNYIECFNTGTSSFATTAPSASSTTKS